MLNDDLAKIMERPKLSLRNQKEAEESRDSAMTIDGSAASDQNAQLELEISMRRTKIRYQVA